MIKILPTLVSANVNTINPGILPEVLQCEPVMNQTSLNPDWYRNWNITFDIHQNFLHVLTLHWRHDDHDGVSNHQPHGCLLNRLFRSRSKKTSKLRVTGLCVGNSPGPVNPPKGPVTRKMFPFDDVIMTLCYLIEIKVAEDDITFKLAIFFKSIAFERQYRLL